MTRIAVVGAGWAGSAAALTLARAGIHVTVFEAGKSAGGRARRVDKDGRRFDNGQHLLLGAYSRSLAMIGSLHASMDRVIMRQPLGLHSVPGGSRPLRLHAPRIRAPLHLLFAILTAQGLTLGEKFASATWVATLLGKRTVSETATVSDLLSNQPDSTRKLLWEPLCIAALNTLPEVASAQVFVDVLRRAFTGDQSASDLIIPRVDLSQLLPVPALAEVEKLGGTVRTATPVVAVRQHEAQVILTTREEHLSFDHVIISTGPQHVARLLAAYPDASEIVEKLDSLQYEPITTVYFEFTWIVPVASEGMLMLDANPGQWLFWRQLETGKWLASVVISAHHRTQTESDLVASSLTQLRRSYSMPTPTWHITITEKRATYACTPAQTHLLRGLSTHIDKLLFAGDWCFPELPATLEAAVISGENAARTIIKNRLNV